MFFGLVAASALGLVALGIYIFAREYAGKRRAAEANRAREQEERKHKALTLLSTYPIEKAVAEFSQYLDDQSGYFSNYQLSLWKAKHDIA